MQSLIRIPILLREISHKHVPSAWAMNLTVQLVPMSYQPVSPEAYINASFYQLIGPSESFTQLSTEHFLYGFQSNITPVLPPQIKVHRLLSQGSRKQAPSLSDTSSLQFVTKHLAEKVSYIFALILIPSFSAFGLVGNVLSLRVLVHHRMRSVTNMLLASLAVSDLLFLLHAIYFFFLRLYTQRNPAAGEQLRAVTFPVLGSYSSVVTARITTGLTTMLSMERLVAVYLPMKAKSVCGKSTTAVCILLVYMLTALMFIPNALKYQCYNLPAGHNQTKCVMGRTQLGKNDFFYLVYGNTLNVLFRIIPLLILILVNILIALAIRRTWSFRRTMSNGITASYEQNRITLMLLMVSLVFLVCILPGAVHSIMDQIYQQYSIFGYQSNLYEVVRSVTYFLETVNSSVNFVIYMAFSTKFCRTYKEIFCCRYLRHGQDSRQSVRSMVRISFRPPAGSRTSMTSYRELYLLKQLRNGQRPSVSGREVSLTATRNGCPTNSSYSVEDTGSRVYRHKKYSNSESYSGHSHSHSSHSHSSLSHSSHSHNHSSHGKVERYSEHSAHSHQTLEHSAGDIYS